MRVSILTTRADHRETTGTGYEDDAIKSRRRLVEVQTSRKKQRKPTSQKPGLTEKTKFKSVLTQPFHLWNEIELIVADFFVDFSNSQRSSAIKNLIRFLELKVITEEYSVSGLLSPTQVVAHVWHLLILETELYRDVVHAIQDFHGRPHRFIHHALFRKYDADTYYNQLERTQRLFKTYYGKEMPEFLRKELDSQGNPIGLPTTVTVQAGSVVSGTIDDVFEKTKSTWYAPWLPTCDCFGVFENAICGSRDPEAFDEIFATQENISLLTPPHGLSDE